MGCGKGGCGCEEITGLAHVGLFVEDIEVSKAFYADVLCFECFDESVEKSDKGDVKIAFMRLGSCVLELVQFPEKKKRSTDSIIAHIALNVMDIEIVQACLEKKGIQFETEKPVISPKVFDKGVKYLMFAGPDGEVLEINETL
jgi:lactoylglutathione lyase